jgi:hypothetical protein
MKRYRFEGKDVAIAKAREIVEEENGGSYNWLTSFVDSYGQERYRIELHVLEGSSPKGYIVVNCSEACETATAFGLGDELLAQIYFGV